MKNAKFFLKHSVATVLSALASRDGDESHVSLMYHSIATKSKDDDLYTLGVNQFKNQMDFLLGTQKNIRDFSKGAAGISITFDDGHLDNYTVAAPYMFEKNLPFTIFMISDFVKNEHKNYLNKEHLVELVKNPLVTIGAHGKTHRPLAKMPFAEACEEMRISKIELEDIIGKPVATMSFPHGSFDEKILKAAKEMGYVKCGTSVERSNPIREDEIRTDRNCIYSCDNVISFKQKLNGQWNWIAKKS